MFRKSYGAPLLEIIAWEQQDVLMASTCTTDLGDRANYFNANWLD